ncbi:uncharacterized protein LOC110379844 [Helicoverpa armigera]|uniref:Uncharacterized protein n=1 Tax=Helicoverpa armigera TaxID=29058 RepID=A0A2W1BGG6_HELAM|nr:uncharacterized protein LOC110379844 [Helicoverpa armigera]PZC74219.1 hypothetical protein B5X24_HaOG208172 [Helicoverpa armigera]
MLYKNPDYLIERRVTLHVKDRKKCAFIADIIMAQCIIVCLGSVSILACVWTPEHSTLDYDKLTRIMYLYDAAACGYKLRTAKAIANLYISNETYGLDLLPIKWQPALTTVSTRFSAKTRKYIEISFTFHFIWFFLAVAFRVIIKNSTDTRSLKITLGVFFYSCVFIIGFDSSMAVVYITHIKQSLTKGMILRYSGWSTEMKLDNYDDFSGWLPIAASACWLRGFVIFMLNLYFCRVISIIRRKIRRREFKKKMAAERYNPFPEPQQVQASDKVLVYRVGEDKPHTRQ